MGAVAVLGLAVAAFIAYGIARTGQRRVHKHGIHALTWRFLTGMAWHGNPVTDAGWLRPGRKALTRTGHASRFHHLPRWRRALWRSGPALAIPLTGWGLIADFAATVLALKAAAAAAVVFAAWRSWTGWRRRKHRRTWLLPAHMALAPVVSVPLPERPEHWLSVTADRSRAVLTLPPGFDHDPKTEEKVVRLAAQKLGMEDPDVKWRRAGQHSQLILEKSDPPPALVTLDDIGEAMARAGRDEIVIGIGKHGKIVTASLHNDSPHFGISMGSGGGKSNLAAFILLQVLMRGAVCLVLDAKWISHPWLIGLPNVAYCRTPAQIHAGLCWLSAELDRRNKVALAAVDAHGRINANVGPRLFVIGEELNLCMPRLKAYWASIRESGDPKESPAITGLGEVAFAGRQVRMHLLLIAQLLTAKATGIQGGEVRENIGVKLLARYSPAAWKMQAPEHPMPPKPTQIGRIQEVTARGVAETQVPKLFDDDPAQSEAVRMREMVLAGQITPCPAGMPGAVAVTGNGQVPQMGPGQPVKLFPAPPVTGPGDGAVSLAEAAGTIVPCSVHVLRMARHRDPAFPAKVAQRGLEHLYDPDALIAWYARRQQ
jgi:hypothetical protein